VRHLDGVRSLIAAVVLVVACGPKHIDYTVPSDEDDPLAQPAKGAEEPAASQPASQPAAPVVSSGSVSRQALAAVLDGGPGAFLAAGVALEPTFAADRFEGWEIRALPADGRYAAVDIGVGDIVTKVNGKLFQRPEEFEDLWESLRFASELTVDYTRHGEPRQLKFAIEP